VLNDRLKHLKWEKSSIIKTQYGNNSDEDKQERIIVVFKKKIKTKNQMMNNDSPDFREERQNKSFEYYRNQFGSIDLINIGTTEMGKSACKNLIKELDITRKDVCWEIGCGRPKLAFCMSATATNTVVATEISKNFLI
jgi:folylpolyglutamate synthase/dihydropteroate synthase